MGEHYGMPRSFVSRIAGVDWSSTYTFSGNVLRMTSLFYPTVVYWAVFDIRWLLWNSSVWPMSKILTDYYATLPPDPTQYPLGYSLWYDPAEPGHGSTLVVGQGGVTTGRFYFPLPPRTVPYWLPDP